MILSVAVVLGFRSAIREKLFSFWGHIHITPYDPDPSAMLTEGPTPREPALVAKLRAVEGVTQVAPYALCPVIARAGTTLEGLQLKGVEEGYRHSPAIRFSGGKLSYADTAYSKDILLSETVAARLNLTPGSALQVYFLEPGQRLPRIRKLRVAGLYHTGMDEVDRAFALCDIRLVQRLAGWAPADITGYQLNLSDATGVEEAVALIDARYVSRPLITRSLPELYPQVFDWLRLQNANVWVLLGIMGVIAVINLSAALLILMVDRARAVGLLKALGQPAGSIRATFVWLAGGVGAVGIVLGNVLGLGLCFLQKATGLFTLPEATYYMREVPLQLDLWWIVLINVATLAAVLLCLLLPALYVRRLNPVRVLQFR